MRPWSMIWLVGLLAILSACSPKEEPLSPFEPQQVIEVVASGKVFTPSEIKAKQERKVKLQVASFGADYYIEIPDLGVDLTKVQAGSTRDIVFVPKRVGTYEFFNPAVPGMRGRILVQACPPEADVNNPIAPTTNSIDTGKEIYSGMCISCHGASGRGDGPQARDLGLKPIDFTQPYMANISDGEMLWVINDGWYGMPSFKDALTQEQRWHVINYIRTFAQQ